MPIIAGNPPERYPYPKPDTPMVVKGKKFPGIVGHIVQFDNEVHEMAPGNRFRMEFTMSAKLNLKQMGEVRDWFLDHRQVELEQFTIKKKGELIMGTVESDGKKPTDQGPVGKDGQHGIYPVLPQDERIKDPARPLRTTYRHVGAGGPKSPLRDLTKEERMHHHKFNYVKYEKYPESESPVVGRFWTQEQLDEAVKPCGAVTTMANDIAETFAKDPNFYGATFCSQCKEHLPVSEFVWEGTQEVLGS